MDCSYTSKKTGAGKPEGTFFDSTAYKIIITGAEAVKAGSMVVIAAVVLGVFPSKLDKLNRIDEISKDIGYLGEHTERIPSPKFPGIRPEQVSADDIRMRFDLHAIEPDATRVSTRSYPTD
jgi:hypothetical protein